MFKHSVLLLFCLLQMLMASAQEPVYSGKVADTSEKKSVQNAVVALLSVKDSVLYTFTRTDAGGNYSFNHIQPGTYILMTTHPYYADMMQQVEISTNSRQLPAIALTSKSKLLQEVIVKTGSPIKIKGDTTVYTADSFKVRPGANVEELLRRLPGIQVDKDGKITAMGEQVKKVLVDGEEFFGDDPGIATKNLRADVVKEVEVYDKKSDQAVFTGIDDGVKDKTINLKLKDNAKKGFFGKLEAGGGSDNLYSNQAMINAFKGKRKLAAYGIMSNSGQTNLDWNDSQNFGGGNDNVTMDISEDGGMMMSVTRSDDGDNFYGGKGGIPQNWNGGLHYSNKFNNNKTSLNTGYKFTKINSPSDERDYSTSFFGDSSTSATTLMNGFTSKIKQSLNLSYETMLDSANTIKFTGRGNQTNTKYSSNYNLQTLNNKSLLINSSIRHSSGEDNNIAFNGTFLWKHKFKKIARTLSVNSVYNLINTSKDGYLYSDNEYYNNGVAYQQDTIDQHNKRENDTRSFSTNITYTEPLSKTFFLSFTYAFSVANNRNDRLSFSKDAYKNYTVPVDSLNNSYRFNQINNQPGISFRMAKKKVNFSIGSTFSHSHFEQDDISRSINRTYDYNNFFPNASFNVKMKNNQGIRLYYNGSSKAPSLDQLQPIVDNTDQINQRTGNPNLKQSFTHTVNANYNFYNVLKERGMWTGLYGSFTQNAFVNESTYFDAGKSVTRTVNSNGNYSFNLYSNYNFKWKKPGMYVSFGPSASSSRNISYVIINGVNQKAINDNNSYGIRTGLRKDKENKYSFSIDPNMSWVKSSNSINSGALANYWQFELYSDASVTIAKKIRFSTDLRFKAKQNDPRFPVKNQYTIWNAEVKRFIYKEELELTFMVSDILNENKGYDRNFYNNQYTESFYSTLKRFGGILLTWNFNKNHPKTANDF